MLSEVVFVVDLSVLEAGFCTIVESPVSSTDSSAGGGALSSEILAAPIGTPAIIGVGTMIIKSI